MLKHKLYKRCQSFHNKIIIILRKQPLRPNDSLIGEIRLNNIHS